MAGGPRRRRHVLRDGLYSGPQPHHPFGHGLRRKVPRRRIGARRGGDRRRNSPGRRTHDDPHGHGLEFPARFGGGPRPQFDGRRNDRQDPGDDVGRRHGSHRHRGSRHRLPCADGPARSDLPRGAQISAHRDLRGDRAVRHLRRPRKRRHRPQGRGRRDGPRLRRQRLGLNVAASRLHARARFNRRPHGSPRQGRDPRRNRFDHGFGGRSRSGQARRAPRRRQPGRLGPDRSLAQGESGSNARLLDPGRVFDFRAVREDRRGRRRGSGLLRHARGLFRHDGNDGRRRRGRRSAGRRRQPAEHAEDSACRLPRGDRGRRRRSFLEHFLHRVVHRRR